MADSDSSSSGQDDLNRNTGSDVIYKKTKCSSDESESDDDLFLDCEDFHEDDNSGGEEPVCSGTGGPTYVTIQRKLGDGTFSTFSHSDCNLVHDNGNVSPLEDTRTAVFNQSETFSQQLMPIGESTTRTSAVLSGEQALSLASLMIPDNQASVTCTSGPREVTFNMTQITSPLLAFGNVMVTNGPPSLDDELKRPEIRRLRSDTKRQIKERTRGMVKTKAVRTVLDKLDEGNPWVTITGSPGEGKTTLAYLVLQRLSEFGREVLVIDTVDDYFQTKDQKAVILLEDIFGAINIVHESIDKWKKVMADMFEFIEDRSSEVFGERRRRKCRAVLMTGRWSVLKQAENHLEKYRDFILGECSLVDISHDLGLSVQEKTEIWRYHAMKKNIDVDERVVRQVCEMETQHGFAHCCQLFAANFAKNSSLDMKYFFTKPIDYLELVMASLLETDCTKELLMGMLEQGGTLNLDEFDSKKQFDFICKAEPLSGAYLSVNGDIVSFQHPSVYDSAAFVLCNKFPKFVIEKCSLSFLNERVRFKGLEKGPIPESHRTVEVDTIRVPIFIKRLVKNIKDGDLSQILAHRSFSDDTFVHDFLIEALKTIEINKLIHLKDKSTRENFLFLISKCGSSVLLKVISEMDGVNLTKEDLTAILFGICESSSIEALEYFVSEHEGFNLDVENASLETPLVVVSRKCSERMLKILLDTGRVDVNMTDHRERTALHNICKFGVNGDGGIVKELVTRGADKSLPSPYYPFTALHSACYEGHTNVIGALLDSGSDVNSTTMFQYCPLYFACRMRHARVLELLLERGASVNQTDCYGRSPLHIASSQGYMDIVKILVENGANVNAVDKYDMTSIYAASLNGHIDVMTFLADRMHDVNMADTCGNTSLHRACYSGNTDAVAMLIERDAEVWSCDFDGDTPLHGAAYWGHARCAELLVEAGAGINVQNGRGNTPLIDACRRGHAHLAQYLASKGGDVHAVNEEGVTPLSLAIAADFWGSDNLKNIFLPTKSDA